MSDNLRALPTLHRPNFEVFSFIDHTSLRDDWKLKLGPRINFLSNHLWMLEADENLRAAEAVGKLILGLTAHYPEFHGIGSACLSGSAKINDEVQGSSFLSLLAPPNPRYVNPERTAQNLIEATNEQLLALDSFYHLPV